MVRIFRSRFAAAAVAACTMAVAVATAVPAQADPITGSYVALGDSYSAGSGILPPDFTANPLCARTTRNYPNLVADALRVDSFTDVTCGNADTRHFYENQHPSVAPQLDAVTSDTDLVTLTIGGNDNGTLIKTIAACMSSGMFTFGLGSPCKTFYGDRFTEDITNKTYPAVKKVLEDIHAKAPSAEVAIVAYPQVMPEDNSNCFLTMPIAKGDVAYINNIQDTLNGVIERAATETGTTFVDMSHSIGHDACKPVGTRWVEPALWGLNTVPVHPNALGMQKMADAVLVNIGG
ncbi:MAG: SGNH/GDSL hydrolase family protein [Rhodococcus sp.]|nr:SGNH/GDSL hydrolase family protein [Rhodococcus sp. (in: high G+C Gram-positive bacteria)]